MIHHLLDLYVTGFSRRLNCAV